METILEFIIANSQSGGAIVALAYMVFGVGSRQKKLTKQLEEHRVFSQSQAKISNKAHQAIIREILQSIWLESKEKRYVNDTNWEKWNKNYPIYKQVLGNGIADAWSQDIITWRKRTR